MYENVTNFFLLLLSNEIQWKYITWKEKEAKVVYPFTFYRFLMNF